MSLKATIFLLGLVWSFQAALGIRFVIDREECFSHKAEYEGDTLHVSFVVIKSDSQWHFNEDGVDLVIHGPTGEQVHDFREQISAKHDFVVQKKGVYRFCFTNKSPYHETIDFDVQLGHFAYYDQHAKDEHFTPLMEQISKLEEALYNIQFEQHWLEAQTDRQAIVNENMSKRAVHKALFESFALIGASVLQVYLLREETTMSRRDHPPEPLDFFIWTVEDVGSWLEEIKLGSYRQIFKENSVNGEYLESMSVFTTEQILHFIRRHHMKWGDFITLCKELRRIKVACLKGEQRVRRPWWAPSCLSVVFVKAAKRNRQSRVVSLKLES